MISAQTTKEISPMILGEFFLPPEFFLLLLFNFKGNPFFQRMNP